MIIHYHPMFFIKIYTPNQQILEQYLSFQRKTMRLCLLISSYALFATDVLSTLLAVLVIHSKYLIGK
jgi:hypothetical protein